MGYTRLGAAPAGLSLGGYNRGGQHLGGGVLPGIPAPAPCCPLAGIALPSASLAPRDVLVGPNVPLCLGVLAWEEIALLWWCLVRLPLKFKFF